MRISDMLLFLRLRGKVVSPEEKVRRRRAAFLYLSMFTVGFVGLATAFIGPRLFSSAFGSSTTVLAVFGAMALIGLALGFLISSRLSPAVLKRVLPMGLLGTAVLAVAMSWIAWELPIQLGLSGNTALILVPVLAFVPFYGFLGATVPSIFMIIMEYTDKDRMPKTLGNLLFLGVFGGALGMILATARLIPYVGLVESMRTFAVLLFVGAVYFWWNRRLLLHAAVFIGIVSLQVPGLSWQANRVLLAQVEGFDHTIRVFGDQDRSAFRMLVGVGHEVAVGVDGTSLSEDIKAVLNAIGNPSGRQIMILGGAGHALLIPLVKAGADAIEIEADPMVRRFSDIYFGAVGRRGIVGLERVAVKNLKSSSLDGLIINVSNGIEGLPRELSTHEFFLEARRALKENGYIMVVYAGIDGDAFHSLVATIRSVFDSVHQTMRGSSIILGVGTIPTMKDWQTSIANGGVVATDDVDPSGFLALSNVHTITWSH